MRLPIPPHSRLLQPDLTISRLDAILRFQPLQIGASLTMFWFARTTVPLLPRLNHSFGIESGIEIGVPLRAVSPNLPAPGLSPVLVCFQMSAHALALARLRARVFLK